MQKVYFYFDDSGVLHRNEASGYFVYAGYVFCNRHDLEDARHKYIHANKEIRKATGLEGELKASCLTNNQKRALFNSVREYETVSIAVKIDQIYDYIMDKKKARSRYKDYILKRCVKAKLEQLIRREVLSPDEDIAINIAVDEQLTGTDGYYDLRDSIQEELEHGIVNWNYGMCHNSVFNAHVSVEIRYCDSSQNYLIQASDILANRIWTSYRKNNESLRAIDHHLALTFP